MNLCEFNWDAFTSGQVLSKLWMLEEWEKVYPRAKTPEVIWLLCGWYGQAAFMINIRGMQNIDYIRSFDLDDQAKSHAHRLNEAWVNLEKFQAHKANICKLRWDSPSDYQSRLPDWVINTSSEHVLASDWWPSVPSGQKVILQGTDMEHDEHVMNINSLEKMRSTFPLTNTWFAGEKHFAYSNGFKFTRYMLIGTK